MLQVTESMQNRAEEVAAMLHLLGNANRLMILCRLAEGEATVSELLSETSLSQSALSQHLGRMRSQGLVAPRRDGQHVSYRIADPRVASVLERLYEVYCAPESGDAEA